MLAQRAIGLGYQDGRTQGGYGYIGRETVRVNSMDTVDVGVYGSSILGSC